MEHFCTDLSLKLLEDEKKIVCVDEKKALIEFLAFLQDFPTCVILGVDEDSVSILVKKLKEINKKKVKELVVCFTLTGKGFVLLPKLAKRFI